MVLNIQNKSDNFLLESCRFYFGHLRLKEIQTIISLEFRTIHAQTT
jgi:hypothetical protein